MKKVGETIYDNKSKPSRSLEESMNQRVMSQWVSAVTLTHKMKANISDCLVLITETRA